MSQISCASTPRLHIIVDSVRTASPLPDAPLSGWQWEFLRGKILRAGLDSDLVKVSLLSDYESEADSSPVHSDSPLIVGMGERVLLSLTGRKSIDKWNLSPLRTKRGERFLGTFGFDRLQKQFELGVYVEKTFHRAADPTVWEPIPERFHLNPEIDTTMEILDGLKDKEVLALDIETGHGQINTIGLAWSPSDAIAINVLPERCGDSLYYSLMRKIDEVLRSSARKILQNFIYDVSYLSAYGLEVRGEITDTMWLMKILWPEFKSGLDNVGRFYTKRAYWKDDGRVADEEGKKKDWGNIRDWTKHYTYNCRDTTGTFEAEANQRTDLKARGLECFVDSYISRLHGPILEMVSGGMPLDLGARSALKSEVEAKVAQLLKDFQREAGSEVNPRSPKQVLAYLKTIGATPGKKFDKEKGESRETADASAIKRIRLKMPDNRALAHLQEIKTLDKALSSYVAFEPRSDSRLTYSLNGCGTESLRWSGGKDAWGRGFNIQTIPREGGDISIKSMFLAPPDWSFVEIDLRQAESRFVAYDSSDATLIDMLESGADVHTHVGNAILRQMGRDPDSIPKEEFKSTWRQLGKKAGHGLNYGMKPRVFVETVFNELDIVISEKDAKLITQAYFTLFPGIPRWHGWIRNELYTKRKLTAPSGWERYFYGRKEDALKEAYSWRPQHTIPWIMNHCLLSLIAQREARKYDFQLIAQVHDSLIFLAPTEQIDTIYRDVTPLAWHPEVILPGGRMVIPIDFKWGQRMSELKDYHHE